MSNITASGLFWFVVTLAAFSIFTLVFPVETLFGLINWLIGLSSLYIIFFGSRNPYSLLAVFALACLVLLAIAPRLEMNLGVTYWGASTSVFDYYFRVSLLSLASIWLFWLTWLSQQNKPLFGEKSQVNRATSSINPTSGIVAILVSLIAVISIFAHNDFSLTSVLFRGGSPFAVRTAQSQVVWLIYSYFLFPIPTITLVLYLLSDHRSRWVTLSLLILVLVGNPPTGMARWLAAMLYLAILVAIAPRIFGKRHIVPIFLFMGLFAIFPLLDVFRHYTDSLSFTVGWDWILNGHFDSMQNFARAMEIEFVTWGRQLVGVLGFFVPRSLWPSKPIGSGHELAARADLNLNNISMNYFGEGYVNFGIFGVLLFAGILGYVLGKFDAQYWRSRNRGRASQAIYLFLLGGTFFLIRGDLMSSYAYLIGTAASVIFVQRLMTISIGSRS